jgi:hypothetical protein
MDNRMSGNQHSAAARRKMGRERALKALKQAAEQSGWDQAKALEIFLAKTKSDDPAMVEAMLLDFFEEQWTRLHPGQGARPKS